MNVYILVEGKRTEKKVYPAWLSILTPHLKKVDIVGDVSDDNYYLISGEGYPSLLSHLKNAIEEVNEISKFRYLVLCLDAEEMPTLEDRMTRAQFHVAYLREMFEERNIAYSKRNPGEICEAHFLTELIKRNEETNHISSFRKFLNLCDMINDKK